MLPLLSVPCWAFSTTATGRRAGTGAVSSPFTVSRNAGACGQRCALHCLSAIPASLPAWARLRRTIHFWVLVYPRAADGRQWTMTRRDEYNGRVGRAKPRHSGVVQYACGGVLPYLRTPRLSPAALRRRYLRDSYILVAVVVWYTAGCQRRLSTFSRERWASFPGAVSINAERL